MTSFNSRLAARTDALRALFCGIALVAGIAGLSRGASAALIAGHEVTPFLMIGYIEKFTLDPLVPGNALSTGAVMRVNGIDVTIPKNSVVLLPAALLTPYEIFVTQNPNANGASGLAVQDSPPPRRPFEASLTGNIVDGKYVAGLVTIFEEMANNGEGVIAAIDYATGDITVGVAPNNTVRLKLNDPSGRYGRPAPGQDTRFSVDSDNPTVLSSTGYPMCVPRSDPKVLDDPLCPAKNRPIDAILNKPLSKFAMRTINAPLPSTIPAAPPIPQCMSCDRSCQAPFMVGDHVVFAGNAAQDSRGAYIATWSLTARLGIYTEPGVDPAYVAQKVSEIGTFGPAMPVPQERQDRLRVEGVTTDPSRTIEVYTVDFDAARQQSVVRYIANVQPEAAVMGRFVLFVQNANAPPPLPALKNKIGTVVGASRQLMVRIAPAAATPTAAKANAKVKPVPIPPSQTLADLTPVPSADRNSPGFHPELVVANGLVAKQYVAPIPSCIFPENTQEGDPLVPNNFECLNFLVKGSQPPSLGQLSPWPGATPPNAVSCGP
jgi:hypothetical protein